MKAIDLDKHMREIGKWVHWRNTTDYFHAGDSNTEVKGIGVMWQGRTASLRKAVEMGLNLVITHEQIDYPEHQVAKDGETQPYEIAKLKFIKDSALVIYRCHDVWDRVAEIGIVHAWGAYLGLGTRLAGGSNATEAVYAAPTGTLLELANYVLGKTKSLGQESVEMVGDPKTKINKVGIGCGAGTNYRAMMALGADAVIGTDDGMRYWEQGSWAIDKGLPLVLVNHTVAEEPGLMKLAEYIGKQFNVKSVFIPQGCMYRTVGG